MVLFAALAMALAPAPAAEVISFKEPEQADQFCSERGGGCYQLIQGKDGANSRLKFALDGESHEFEIPPSEDMDAIEGNLTFMPEIYHALLQPQDPETADGRPAIFFGVIRHYMQGYSGGGSEVEQLQFLVHFQILKL